MSKIKPSLAESGAREHIDSDILSEMDRVNKAVEERVLLEKAPSCDTAKKQSAEEIVCIAARSLFSTYRDSVLWSGTVHDQTRNRVRRAFEAALACLSVDPRCISSVTKRLHGLNDGVTSPLAKLPVDFRLAHLVRTE